MLDKHILKNGMVILGESMEAVESVAFGFLLPAGAALMPAGCCGAANVIAEWIFRGAGDKDNRTLNDALDGLGLHRGVSVGSNHLSIGSVLESENLTEALDLYADIILRPALPQDQFELARQLAIDAILGLEDDPRQKVMLKLREQFYPDPLGRSSVGDIDQLKTLTAQKTTDILQSNFNLSQTIFAVAGKYNFDSVVKQMEKLFTAERQNPLEEPAAASTSPKYTHIHNEGAQVHIGAMTKTVKPADDDYYNARAAVSVLSGGMSARLFTEVREKRGLCYAIGARYHGLKGAAGVACYAGTTADKAQETFDVIMTEFKRLADGISEEELASAKVGLKSALILSSESSSSRASSIETDYYILNRVRTLEEIKEKIEQISVDSVLDFLRKNRFEDFTVVTIGPKEIEVSI